MLLLNIAGLGPIFGALAGACWGPRVYLWIVFGTILGGGVHDFMSGMMSERRNGASISEMMVLWAGAVYLHRNGFPPVACFMCALPATFMSAVSITYFFQAPECLGLSTAIAYPMGIAAAALFLGIFLWREWVAHKNDVKTTA